MGFTEQTIGSPGGGDSSFDGNRPITLTNPYGLNVGTTTVADFLDKVFFPALPPIAVLTGGSFRELGSSPALTLSWSGAKQTNPITLIHITHNAGGGPLTPDSWEIPGDAVTQTAGDTETFAAHMAPTTGNCMLAEAVPGLTPGDSYTFTFKAKTTNTAVLDVFMVNASVSGSPTEAWNFSGPSMNSFTALSGPPGIFQTLTPAINGTIATFTANVTAPASGILNPVFAVSVNGKLVNIEGVVLQHNGVGPNLIVNGDFANWSSSGGPTITPTGTDTTITNGINIVPTGNTQSGTRSASAVQDLTATYTLTVTAGADTSTSVSTVTWGSKRYWGKIASNSVPSDGDILALTGAGIGSGSEMATNYNKDYSSIAGGGEYLMWAWPTSFGATPLFTINGLPNSAFTKIRDNTPFVNASGGTVNYDCWISNTVQNSPITSFIIS